jgi:hypothetical protein
MEYGDAVGLWLNIPRARHQDAFVGSIGDQIAKSSGPLDDAYGDALALTDGEAMELIFQINAERKANRIINKD